MSRERDPRIAKAFTAMKSLGIAAETVKPVLKRLLKLYDRNWELIEDGNYRALADAIFESMDEAVQNSAAIHAEPEPPLKKHHRAVIEDQVSSTMDNGSMLGLQEGQLSQGSSESKLRVSPETVLRAPKSQPGCHLPSVPPRDKGKDPISNLTPKEEHLAMGGASNAPVADQGVHERGLILKSREDINENVHGENMNKPEREQPANHFTNSSVPLLNVYTDKKGTNAACDHSRLESTFDIASSACGRVKLSLTCNHAFRQQNFRNLSLDTVLKFVESKYLKTYKVADPQFSLFKLLRELCESYLELGADSASSSLLNKLPSDSLNTVIERNKESFRIEYPERDSKKRTSSGSGSSNSLMVAHQQPTCHDKRRSLDRISDITNGTEKVSISLVDEIGGEQMPKFVYVPQNIVYQSAYVHVSLARIADEDCCSSCREDCLSSSVPCECSRETGGEFAYTTEGLLKEEFLTTCISMNQEPQNHNPYFCPDCPLERAKNGYKPENCKGHLVRKFIKECWRKCGCNMQCGNRVVQRGISRKLQVFLTHEGKGWGVRTLEELPKGAFVCEYVGEILTNMELYERNQQNSKDRHTYPVLLDADWGSERVLKDEDALCLDATYYGNVARFINHRCFDGNLLEIPVEVENPDHHYYHLAFFTMRKLNALEELTWDYGIDFDDRNHPVKAFQCCCGSAYCRDKKGKGVKGKYISV